MDSESTRLLWDLRAALLKAMTESRDMQLALDRLREVGWSAYVVIDEAGAFRGSVSGGCIEGAVVTEALGVLAEGRPRLLSYGVTDEMAWEVGLSCGGTIEVFVETVE